jgi:hypothetical protein
MEKSKTIKEFINLALELKKANETFQEKFKISFHDYRIKRELDIADDVWYNIKEKAITLLIGFTILHFIISLNLESIDFFSLKWFIFYLILSFIYPIAKYFYVEKRDKEMQDYISDINRKFAAIDEYYNQNQDEIDSCSYSNNYEEDVDKLIRYYNDCQIQDQVYNNVVMARINKSFDSINESISKTSAIIESSLSKKN